MGKRAGKDPNSQQKIYVYKQKLTPGLSVPVPGLQVYTYMKMIIIVKKKTNKFDVEPLWEGGMKIYLNGVRHNTKMAATPIYGT